MAVPMQNGQELEKLFLLELLVDNVQFDWEKIGLEKDVLIGLKQCCIRFEFLNYPVIEVCEEDFCEKDEKEEERNEVSFKCGKSCLFSIRSVTPELTCFMIRATVLRKKGNPPHHVLGKACISLGNSFINLINDVHTANDEGPATESIKDKYSIRNAVGQEIGKLTLFTRLSCFGKMIITQFQITDEEKKTFFFKNEETNVIATAGDLQPGAANGNYSIKPMPGASRPGRTINPCDSIPAPPTVNCGQGNANGYGPGGMMPNMNPYGINNQSFEMIDIQPHFQSYGGLARKPEDLLGGSGGLFGGSPLNMLGSPFEPTPIGLFGGSPNNMYNNTFSSTPAFNPMAMNHMAIYQDAARGKKRKHQNLPFWGRVPIAKESSSSEDEEETPPPPPSLPPPLNLCECDYPLPAGFGMQCPPPPPPKKKKKKKKKKKVKCPMELGGNYCFNIDCPLGYPTLGGLPTSQCTQMQMPPGTIALKQDQVVFQMPPPIPPPNPYGYNGVWNPGDMFSMRVGRKNNANDQNTKVELQFQPQPKKNVCKLEVETQYEPTDFGGIVQGEDKGKGKDKKATKGKGKRGKK